MGVEEEKDDEVFEGIIRELEDMEQKLGEGEMECSKGVP